MNTKHTETPFVLVTILEARERHGFHEVTWQSVRRVEHSQALDLVLR